MKKHLTTVLLLPLIAATLLLFGCGSQDTPFDETNAIHVVTREPGSGTRGAFIEMFTLLAKYDDGRRKDTTTLDAITTNRTDVMLTTIAVDTHAIGYVSMGSLSDTVQAVRINGVEATPDSVKSGNYKASRPFSIITKGEVNDLKKDFIDFILSEEGQAVVTENKYIAVNNQEEPFTGNIPGGRIVVSGSSSVTPVMEKLKENYLALNPNAKIEIQLTDSTAGVRALLEGICDIGMLSRDLSQSEIEEQIDATVIALDGLAVIVSQNNPCRDLTTEEVRQIFSGEYVKWNDF
jgi:phosphate transport system substrate-binding protein